MARHWQIALLFALIGLLVPEYAYAAHQALQCNAGRPTPGTSLYNAGSDGACQFVGIRYIFSTIICQFVTMVNIIMGKLYCSIQAVVTPVLQAAVTLFIAIYGVQVLMGTAQLNAGEVISRSIKIALVLWLVTDPSFGVSAGIALMFNFFVSFISDTTRWVVQILDQKSGINLYVNYAHDPGVTATFKFLDDWIYNALTGSLSQSNAKVMGFFVAMMVAMPSIFFTMVYWLVSVLKMLMATLLSFLMAVVSVAFLLGLSPIFISFMLFKVTFQYFDQWLRFMVSYSLQVMVSFAILTLWVFSLSLFGPFFNEMSNIIFPYEKIIRPAAAIYSPADTWGLCPLRFTYTPEPHVYCQKANFNPVGPLNPGDNQAFPAGRKSNDDYDSILPPTKVPEMSEFLFYVFYHMITLIIVSYGFATLQKNSKDIAKQLAGPSYTPMLNIMGMGENGFGRVTGAHGEANRFMSKNLFSGFNRRHDAGKTPYENMVQGAHSLVSGR